MYKLKYVQKLKLSLGNSFKLDLLTMKFECEFLALETCWGENLPKNNLTYSQKFIDSLDDDDDASEIYNMMQLRLEEPDWKLLFKADQFTDFVEFNIE